MLLLRPREQIGNTLPVRHADAAWPDRVRQVPGAVLRAEAPLGGSVARPGLRPATALVIALAHLAAIGAAALVLPRRMAAPRQEPALAVLFQPPALPAAPQVLASAALPAETVSEAEALSPVPTLNLQADIRALSRAVRHQEAPRPVQATSQAASVPHTAVPRMAAPPTPAVPHASAARALAAWEAQVHQAVQDALIYPNAARLMHREGRTRVRFEYGHGGVFSVSVAESSGVAVLDQAALAAVTRAAIPPVPPEFFGQTRSLILWVRFSLTAEDG